MSCIVENCAYIGKNRGARGYCAIHYNRLLRGASLNKPIEIHIRGRICSVEGCGRKHHCHDFCSFHVDRFIPRKPSKYKCSIVGCNGLYASRGYCDKHYRKLLIYGDPLKTLRRTKCSLDSCERKHFSSGYCKRHYWSLKKYGDPLTIQNNKQRLCVWPGCQERGGSRSGYCKRHRHKTYMRQKSGDPRYNSLEEIVAMNNVRKRDGNSCKWYGCTAKATKKQSIHVNHIFPKSEYPEFAAEEKYMICYCIEHHQQWHEARGDIPAAKSLRNFILYRQRLSKLT